MLGLHLVWCLWFCQKPIIIQDAREGVERLIKALENRQNTMECLHGLPASSTVTQKGTFWFCGEERSTGDILRVRRTYIVILVYAA